MVKKLSANAGAARDTGSIPELGRYPGGGHGDPTPVFLSGESHGQRSLVDHSPQGRRVRHDQGDLAHITPDSIIKLLCLPQPASEWPSCCRLDCTPIGQSGPQ